MTKTYKVIMNNKEYTMKPCEDTKILFADRINSYIGKKDNEKHTVSKNYPIVTLYIYKD